MCSGCTKLMFVSTPPPPYWWSPRMTDTVHCVGSSTSVPRFHCTLNAQATDHPDPQFWSCPCVYWEKTQPHTRTHTCCVSTLHTTAWVNGSRGTSRHTNLVCRPVSNSDRCLYRVNCSRTRLCAVITCGHAGKTRVRFTKLERTLFF